MDFRLGDNSEMKRPSPVDRSTSVFRGILLRRIGVANLHDDMNVDRMVDRLCSIYPEYMCHNRQFLAESVRQLLPGSNINKRELMIPRKIRKDLDESEEKLPKKISTSFRWSFAPKFKGLGRMIEVIWKLIEELVVPLYRQEELRYLGLELMTGILLHGPPGCGKTKLAHVIADEIRVPFYKISASELVSGVSGASVENIQELFAKAFRTTPSIIFIDEIDVIASKTEEHLPRQSVTQLMACMDEAYRLVKPVDRNEDSESSNSRPGYVLVIGATNRPDAIDPALRRPGRFDYEIGLGPPDEEAQVQILTALTHNLRVEGAIDLTKVARSTPGYVGADLAALAKTAGKLAMKSIINHRKDDDLWRHTRPHAEVKKVGISTSDFEMHEATVVAMKDKWASRHGSSVDHSPDEHFKRTLPSVPEEEIQVPSEIVEKLHMQSE